MFWLSYEKLSLITFYLVLHSICKQRWLKKCCFVRRWFDNFLVNIMLFSYPRNKIYTELRVQGKYCTLKGVNIDQENVHNSIILLHIHYKGHKLLLELHTFIFARQGFSVYSAPHNESNHVLLKIANFS